MNNWPIFKIDDKMCFPVFTWQFVGEAGKQTTFTWWAQTGASIGFMTQRMAVVPPRTGQFFSRTDLQQWFQRREHGFKYESEPQSILSAPVMYPLPRIIRRLETVFVREIWNAFSSSDYDPLSPLYLYPKRLGVAADWLFKFYVQTSKVANLAAGYQAAFTYAYAYTLDPAQFGETLHIFACNTLIGDYRPPNGNPPKFGWSVSGTTVGHAAARYEQLFGLGYGPGPGGSDEKRDMNRFLLVPMLIDNPIAKHGKILGRLLSAQHEEIDAAVTAAVRWTVDGREHLGEAPREVVDIWIRNSTSNETTNMTQQRFAQIVAAIPPGHGIVLLGDQPPGADWDKITGRVVANLTGLSDPSSPVGSSLLKAQAGTSANLPIFYKTQASALVTLYRRHRLYCVIGNKSGGMDLAAFAAIPSIQISPDVAPDPDSVTYQRLVFTSLCSPFWRIVHAPKGGEVPEPPLTAAIKAAKQTKELTRSLWLT